MALYRITNYYILVLLWCYIIPVDSDVCLPGNPQMQQIKFYEAFIDMKNEF